MVPTIGSSIGSVVPQRALSERAALHASPWFQRRIASSPSSCMNAIPAGAASQGVGSRVPVRSNSASKPFS